MAITRTMGEIYEAYEEGVPIEVLALRYNISQGSVNKKLLKAKQALNPKAATKKPAPLMLSNESHLIWTIENIKKGIDKFYAEYNRMPTARDFDEMGYLPSARQVQRSYGGVVKLRETLGYSETDYTRGNLRKAIAISANKRGITAEDYIEPILIEKFGEPFVHVQKRYFKGSKYRYDFFVYAKDKSFGIDIFTTDRANYIEKNIRHKIHRYKNAPPSLDIFFVLVGEEFTSEDVEKGRKSVSDLKDYPNMHAVHESEFIKIIEAFEPLTPPNHLESLSSIFGSETK